MRVGIFGATGQIGKALSGWLHAFSDGGFQVTVVRRKSSKVQFENGIRVVEMDLLTEDSISGVLSRIDHAIFAIGSPEKWVSEVGHFEKVNVEILQTFLGCLRRFPNVSLTYFSTFEVFSDREGTISESNPPIKKGATPYYQSMVKAYGMVREEESKQGLKVVYIHPAAVYGGINTGLGLTDYLVNLKHGRFWKAPSVPSGMFPIVHVDSLSAAVGMAIAKGCYGESLIISDTHISLRELAKRLREICPGTFVPFELPLPVINASVAIMELVSEFTKSPPLISKVQVKYVSQGLSVDCSKARALLGWDEMDIAEGFRRMFGRA